MLPLLTSSDPVNSGVHIEFDPDAARVLKEARNRRLHVEQIPVLRLVGFTFFALGVGLHNWLLLDEVSWWLVLQFAGVLVSYSLASWLLLRRVARRRDPLLLGEAFLVADILFLTAAVYLSGGEQSWIYFLLLFRVADQAPGGLRRALLFTHLCVAAYVAMLAYIVLVDGRSLGVEEAVARSLFLYLGAWYVSLCALPVERRRRSIRHAIHTARDLIARLRTAMTALAEARVLAEEATAAKDQFLATMSHELRTPLTSVIGGAELLGSTPLDQEQRVLVDMLQRGAHTTLKLVSDVLDVAALDQGGIDLEHIPFNPTAVVREVVADLEPAARAKGLELTGSLGADVPDRVLGDPRRTRQLLRILVDNAVKFTAVGHITVSCELGNDGGGNGGARLRWTVEDTGIGFDAADLPRLMQDFVQADGSASRRYQGSGLGLALARRLVAALGGALEATSVPGQGSRFTVELPYLAATPATA